MKGFWLALIALSALPWTFAAGATTNGELPKVIDSLLAEMYARPSWYHRWVLSSPWLRQNVPELTRRAYRAESQLWMKSGEATRKLAALGTNAWPAIPILVDGVTQRGRGGLAMRTISVLAQVEADKHPDWNKLVKTWRGHAGLATNLAYLLYTKNEFAQPYDARHRRFGLLGLGAVGPAAQPVSQHVIGVLKTDDDHQLWPLAAAALRNAQVESSSFVPLLSATLRDSDKHPYARASAAGALGEVMPATPETLGLLRESLQNEFSVIRLAAARSRLRLGAPAEEVLPVIESLLGHKLRTVRLGALKVVCEMGRVAQPLARAVEERLRDENEDVRGAAKEALVAIERKKSE